MVVTHLVGCAQTYWNNIWKWLFQLSRIANEMINLQMYKPIDDN